MWYYFTHIMCVLCQQFTGTPDMAEKFLVAAYIDPGAGFVFSSVIPFALGTIIAALGSFLIFIRKKIVPFIKRCKIVVASLILILVVGTIIVAVKENSMKKILIKNSDSGP